ncbi:MAG: NUDIX hydrolase [Pyrinomonadaceae bacterium]
MTDHPAGSPRISRDPISSDVIYKGQIFDVRIDEIQMGESRHKREVVVHKGSAVIIPVFENNTVALVRQFRQPAGKSLLEIPAGSLDGDESPETGAARELEEEIGVKAHKIEKLSEFWVSPGFLTEKMHLFLATQLTNVGQNLDNDEDLEIERYSFSELFEMLSRGEIEDAKTVIAIYQSADRLGIQHN